MKTVKLKTTLKFLDLFRYDDSHPYYDKCTTWLANNISGYPATVEEADSHNELVNQYHLLLKEAFEKDAYLIKLIDKELRYRSEKHPSKYVSKKPAAAAVALTGLVCSAFFSGGLLIPAAAGGITYLMTEETEHSSEVKALKAFKSKIVDAQRSLPRIEPITIAEGPACTSKEHTRDAFYFSAKESITLVKYIDDYTKSQIQIGLCDDGHLGVSEYIVYHNTRNYFVYSGGGRRWAGVSIPRQHHYWNPWHKCRWQLSSKASALKLIKSLKQKGYRMESTDISIEDVFKKYFKRSV